MKVTPTNIHASNHCSVKNVTNFLDTLNFCGITSLVRQRASTNDRLDGVAKAVYNKTA